MVFNHDTLRSACGPGGIDAISHIMGGNDLVQIRRRTYIDVLGAEVDHRYFRFKRHLGLCCRMALGWQSSMIYSIRSVG